jgi:RHS repeat-associated protein
MSQGRNQDRAQTARGTASSAASTGKDERFSAPAVTLPKGGGAIKGIGEQFAANPVTGTGKLTIPLPLSPGRSGFTPAIALEYDSGTGNGPYGLGWKVDVPSISRRTDQGLPLYHDAEDSDVFQISGAEDLVPAVTSDGSRDERTRNGYRVTCYRPRIEGMFSRIERWASLADRADVFWRSISRDNVTTFYGKSVTSRIVDPSDPEKIFAWLMCESFDDKGNATVYEYIPEDSRNVNAGLASESNRSAAGRTANRYLKRVKYGNQTSRLVQPDLSTMEWLFELVMDYGDHSSDLPAIGPDRDWPVRPDPFSTSRAGFEVRTYRRCQRLLMFHRFAELGASPRLVRSLELDFDDFAYPPGFDVRTELAWQGSTRAGSLLRRATVSGYADSGLRRSMPPLELTYARPQIVETVQTLADGSYANLPAGIDDRDTQWLDLHGEGLSGVLTEQDGAWWYKPNLGNGRLGPVQRVAQRPSTARRGRTRFLDLDGDGALDLVELDHPRAGFYEHGERAEWSAFRPFHCQPDIAFDDPNLRLVDLTGDGRADILITQDDRLCWHPSLGEQGFGPRISLHTAGDEASGPRVVFADGTETIFLADMSGDGLPDVVRIRRSQVCYWPNLGHGRFGRRITMDGAPVLDAQDWFDPRRVRLADIDGSGTVDLLYLDRDAIRIFFNRAGNGWTPPYTLRAFPGFDHAANVQLNDLLGNGTACLVWSSPLPHDAPAPLRYVDLMGGQKPHLLIGIENNLGARTVIGYTASTQFYRQDQQAGRPWITRLPFPVHVVERIETYDEISRNRFVTRYAYHHGLFDGVEREFRGFGMVEQIDTEEVAVLQADPQPPSSSNLDQSSHVPPMLTRTWFHTGAFLGADRISRYFAGLLDGSDRGEYYREPGLSDAEAAQRLLDDTVLPSGLTADEQREACRALKGMMLRQEIYALDGTDKQPHPYVVTEQNFALRRIQAKGGNRHAVFFSHPRESIVYHYERVPSDPRVVHEAILEVDEFGNTLKSASTSYGRRTPDPGLAAEDQARQAAIHIVYSDHRVTNSIQAADDYRTPLPSEARDYELTGLALSGGASRFTLEQLATAGTTAAELAYEQVPAPGSVQKRLIEHVRTLYRRNDLSDALPLGQLESLALVYEVYKLALTPGLITSVYGTRLSDAMLSGDGGYVHSESDAQWWIPSGRVFYSPTDGTPAAELVSARQHFFLPRRFRDPFGQSTQVAFDPYDLLLAETRDALDNRVTVGERDVAGNLVAPGHDYRVLKPRVVTDPNACRSAISFDALGMVTAFAVMGKLDDSPRRGDLLDGVVADLSDDVVAAHLADPLADPHAVLGRATMRQIYDCFAYYRTKQAAQPSPTVVYTLTRETHDADLGAGQQSRTQHRFAYADGLGREIQSKTQAEPGPVPVREGNGRIVVVDGVPQLTTTPVSPRWVGSGWTVFNNKGLPVREFEPFFTDRQSFEFDVRIGVSPIVCYDPIDRVVATVHANHTWEKVIYGAWQQASWDVHDTLLITDPRLDPDVGAMLSRLDSADVVPTWYAQREAGDLGSNEQDTAIKAAAHAATPAIAIADSLGRTFLTIAHNRFKPSDAAPSDPPVEEYYLERTVFDIEGNVRRIVDAAGRTVVRNDHDMLRKRIHVASMEAGERWILDDVRGTPIHAYDSRGHHVRTEYDALRRPVRAFVQGADPQRPTAEILVARTEYGEGQPSDLALNLRTRPYREYDGAGVVTNVAFDFKGNLLVSRRQLTADYKTVPDWSGAPAFEQETFANSTAYDALDRPVTIATPDASIYRPAFNEANLLDRVDVQLRGAQTATSFIASIDYDAKGQRTQIVLGNNTRIDYTYDRLTLRLAQLVTTRTSDQATLQDLSYTYDAIGNVTRIRDAAQQTIYFNNQVVTPDCSHVYDAVYRLIHTDAREHVGQSLPTTWNDEFRVNLPHPGDGQAMRRYGEDYRYDVVGNILQLVHQASNGNWTRSYTYQESSQLEPDLASNRLSRTVVGTNSPDLYSHDAHGNMAAVPHLTVMQWDYRDQLSASSRQAVNNNTPETTYYVYSSIGDRARKVTERQNGTRKSERIYLAGFEVYRAYDAGGTTVTLQRDTLHVMDGHRRIALVDTRATGTEPGVPQRLIRYQLDNHLGSATLELDDQAQIISYEEYHPFGSTSYQAGRSVAEVSLKRYRYTGKERDDETGFAYHGARYYAPWLARWTSCDPHGMVDGPSLYVYARNNPLRYTDPTGTQGAPFDEQTQGGVGLTFDAKGVSLGAISTQGSPARCDELNPACKPIVQIDWADIASRLKVIPIKVPQPTAPTLPDKPWVFRGSDTDPLPTELGFKAKNPASTTTPVEHVLGKSDSPWISVSETREAARTFGRQVYGVSVPNAGTEYVPSAQLQDQMTDAIKHGAVDANRGSSWLNAQNKEHPAEPKPGETYDPAKPRPMAPPEKEGVMKNQIPREAVFPAENIDRAARARTQAKWVGRINKFGRGLAVLGIAMAVKSIAEGAYETFKTGNPRPLVNAVVGTAAGFAGAYGGAKLGFAIGTAIGGPIGAALGTIVGGLVGSFIASGIAGKVLDWLW